MRDTTVRQPRVPHSVELLCTDCNVRANLVQDALYSDELDNNAELHRSVRMFELFLNGSSYNTIAYIFNTSSYDANRCVHQAYTWVKRYLCREEVAV